MKKIILDEEEKEIIKAFREGKMVRVKNFKNEKKRFEKIAKYTQKLLEIRKHPFQQV
ncbi:MAG: hypothetical protein AAB907_02760 [Patescibacteria group bacterium]